MDTTLRDGEQTSGVSFSASEKLTIAQLLLTELKVDRIEIASARVSDGDSGPSDMVWAPLPAAGRALVMGRNGESFRARERRQAAALARIVDTRFRELMNLSRHRHPSVNG